MRPTDVKVCAVEHTYEDYQYRTPIKFGGVASDKVTLLNVRVRIRNRNGIEAEGFGSMPLGNVWSFPSRLLGYDRTLQAMKRVADALDCIVSGYKEFADPIEINWQLEPEYLRAAAQVTAELNLGVPIPKLCTLVVASAFDAAIHDGFGKAAGMNCYHCYSHRHITYDLIRYLDEQFTGEYPDRYVSPDPKPSMDLYHLVGALDPLVYEDVKDRVGDGLPETLEEWVLAEGLRYIKIKLNGDDLQWDLDRLKSVDRVVSIAQEQRRETSWCYSLDFNERCADTSYLLEFLRRASEYSAATLARIQYIEQPTARDLTNAQAVHDAAQIKPVVIDESLVDYESLLQARRLGYSGVALKACKGQSNALIMAAAARKFDMFLCVQDLTCPGASLIQSASLAAHIPGVAAIEANARQYVPAANKEWEARFPGLFRIRNGKLRTADLNGPGLGAVAEHATHEFAPA